MQVSQLAEPSTYAVVGGGAARDFRMGQSAQAFRMLSDTLYRDKHLAVVREILCNAVDAHIVAGIPDRPVEVTLTDDELTIKDFGPGIADDRMVEVYATYFGSTKQSDDKQTGGFGLGSKAPIAYTDHFTVTSCHNGQKCIYAIHVGDDVNDGAPALRLMARVPTTESGLTVQVPLADPRDRSAFQRKIEDVVYGGGMKVLLNGKTVKTLDLDPIRREGFGLVLGNGKIKVLYANVLYDVDGAPAGLDRIFTKIQQHLMGRDRYGYNGDMIFNLILYAPPSSIGVTPSREGLSFGEKTTATLTKIAQRTLNMLTDAYKGALKRNIRRALVATKTDRRTIHEFCTHIGRNTIKAHFKDTSFPLTGALAIAEYISQSRLGTHSSLTHTDVIRADPRRFGRILMEVVAGSRWKQRVKHRYIKAGHDEVLATLARRDLARIGRKFGVTDRMMRIGARWNQLVPLAQPLTDYEIDKHRGGKCFNRIIVAPSKGAAASKSGDTNVYIVDPALTGKRYEALRDYAVKLGFKVDFIEPVKVERKPPVKKAEKVDPALTFRRFPTKTRHMDGQDRYISEPALEGKPTAMLEVMGRTVDGYAGHWFPTGFIALKADKLFTKLVPDLALPWGIREADALIKLGVPHLQDWLLDKLEGRSARRKANDEFYYRMALYAHAYPDSSSLGYWLCRHSREGAFLAFGLPYEPSVEDDEDYLLWRATTLVFDKGIRPQRNNSDHTHYYKSNERYLAMVKALGPKAYGRRYEESDLDHGVQVFAEYVNHSIRSRSNFEEIAAIIGFLNTRKDQ
jgi:hypothetical protein